MLRKVIYCLFFGTLISGCASLKPAPIVHLKTPGVVIDSEDHTVFLESGKTIKTPFFTKCGLNVFGYGSNQLSLATKNALNSGAKRVMVKTSDRADPYYGVMTFCGLSNDNYGPATRSYEIEIPDSYFQSASDGRISAVYELVNHRTGASSYAWVIWISDRPF